MTEPFDLALVSFILLLPSALIDSQDLYHYTQRMGNSISTNAELPERSAMSKSNQEQHTISVSPSNASQQVDAPASNRTEKEGHFTRSSASDRRKHDSRKRNEREDKSLPTGAIVLLVGIFLSGALTGKALSASQRARRAESSARSWERAVLALAGNNRKANNFQHITPKQPSSLRDTGNNESISQHEQKQHVPSWAEKKVYDMIGVDEKDAGRKVKDIASDLWVGTKERLPISTERSFDEHWEFFKDEAIKGAQSSTSPKRNGNISGSSVNNTFVRNNRSLYSAIHPHEDWNWTPADHPKTRKSWQKSRLPPWTVGFTSTPKAQEIISSSIAPRSDIEIAHGKNLSEDWRPFETADISEAEFIAEEVSKDHQREGPASRQTESRNAHRQNEDSNIKNSIKNYTEGAAKRDQMKKARIEDVALRRKMIEQKLLQEEEKRKKLSEDEMKSKMEKHRMDKRMQRVDLLKRIQEIRSKKAKQGIKEAEEAKARMQERVRRIKEKSEAFFKQREAAMKQAQKHTTQEKQRPDNDLPEINDIIQRQMWALMARAEALESKIRRFDSQHYFK